MANLLPTEYRQGLKKEYKFRLGTGVFGLLVLSLLVGILLLIPSFVLTITDLRAAQSQLETVSAPSSSQSISTENEQIIAITNEKIKQAKSTKELSPTTVIEDIMTVLPSGIELTSLALSRNDNGQISARISGISQSRSNLLSFRDQLNAQPELIDVELPVSALAARENVSFSLSLTANSSGE